MESHTLSNQPPQQLNQKRLNEYLQQFKAPVLTVMANMTQTIPNTIDELIKQCVLLEGTVEKLTTENKKLMDEKVLANSQSVTGKKTNVKELHIPTPKDAKNWILETLWLF